jgi:cytidine deaminase
MAKINVEELINAAAQARQLAVAPHSEFLVGAALLTRTEEVITGANVESASYGLTCCAERVALFKALTSGQNDFIAIAVVAKSLDGSVVTPCGACRQLLAEYAPNADVFAAHSESLKKVKRFTVAELLPGAFTGEALG